MLISKNVRIGHIISGTGRYAKLDLSICVAAFFHNEYILRGVRCFHLTRWGKL